MPVERALRIGVGGPVGSGKTSLIAALCGALADEIQLGVVTNDIYTTEDAEFLRSTGVLPEERITAVQTGGCPHTAIRDDISANLEAVEELEAATGPLDLVFVESGGDNLTAIFSPALADVQIFVIDVAGGDDIPRKGGPGIARADLLVINKTDLAPYVGADDVEDGPRGVRAARRAAGRRDVAAHRRPAAGRGLGAGAARGVPRPRPPPLVHGRRARSPPRSRPLSRASRRCGAASGSRRACSRRGGSRCCAHRPGRSRATMTASRSSSRAGTLTVEPIAANVALPGPERTVLELDVTVGAGARLILEDAPLVVAAGADVLRTTTIRLAPGAVAIVRDVVILGRAGEGPGRLESVLRCDGILHDALRVDPETWAEDAYVALAPGHRAIGTYAELGVPGNLHGPGHLERVSAPSAADVEAACKAWRLRDREGV